MAKKGIIEEIFSKARFADDPKTYQIFYRDFDIIKQLSLIEFEKESDNFETIPASRIQMIKKKNKILFTKQRQEWSKWEFLKK